MRISTAAWSPYRDMNRNEESVREFSATLTRDKGYTAAYTSRGNGLREDGLARQSHRRLPHRSGHTAEIQQRRLGSSLRREPLKALGVDVP